jgi:hypothetical protein
MYNAYIYNLLVIMVFTLSGLFQKLWITRAFHIEKVRYKISKHNGWDILLLGDNGCKEMQNRHYHFLSQIIPIQDSMA